MVALDHDISDPVDLVVNGRIIAKGELVALDDNPSKIGVKLTEIVGKSRRLRHLIVALRCRKKRTAIMSMDATYETSYQPLRWTAESRRPSPRHGKAAWRAALLGQFDAAELKLITRSAAELGSVPIEVLEELVEEFASDFGPYRRRTSRQCRSSRELALRRAATRADRRHHVGCPGELEPLDLGQGRGSAAATLHRLS